MKPFNLKEYRENPSRKVVTRDGRKVRIVCTDSDTEGGPIIAIVTMANQRKHVLLYHENGKYFSFDSVSENDLFFAPSKHTDYINIYRDERVYFLGAVYTSEEYAKNIAKGNDQYITTIKVEWEE